MAQETFAVVIERKRVRLHGEREATFTEQQELDTKLAVLTHIPRMKRRFIGTFFAIGNVPSRVEIRSAGVAG